MKINKRDLVKIIHESINNIYEELDYEDIPFPPYEDKKNPKNLEKVDKLANELYSALAGLGESFSGYAEIAYEITQLIGAHLEDRQ